MSATASIFRRAATIALSLIVGTCAAQSQSGLWPMATLQPPGLDVAITALADVALAGDVAVTAYAPSASLGYRVFLRQRTAQGWGAPQLLVQGQPGEGQGINIDADADRIAIGLPKSDGNGRVDLFVRSGSTWLPQQSLPAAFAAGSTSVAVPNFGFSVSIRRSLLAVSSGDRTITSQFDVYRFSSATANWVKARESFWNPLSPNMTAMTDGYGVVANVNGNCVVHSIDGAGGLAVETRAREGNGQAIGPVGSSVVAPAANQNACAIDNEWFFVDEGGTLRVYKRNGTQWLLSHDFGPVSLFAAAEGRLILRAPLSEPVTTSIYEVDAAGAWQPVGTAIGAFGARLAINAELALSGIQSFADSGTTGWVASGVVEGVPDAINSMFGSATVLAANRVWIGSAGFNGDTASGAVWMEPLDGNSSSIPRFIDVPSSPAPYMGFGAAIATDGMRVAVASRHPTSGVVSPLRVRVYAATSTSHIAEIVVPDTPSTLWTTAIAIDGDTLVLTRSGNQGGAQIPDVQVYRDTGNGYTLIQTIQLPESAYGNSGRGQMVKLSGDWLLAGRRRYERVAGGDFVDRGEIPTPSGNSGLVYNFQRVGHDAQRIVVAITYDPSSLRIASVFHRDAVEGWIHGGDVLKGSSTAGPCSSVAISNVAVVCAGFSGNVLHIAKELSSSSWTVTDSIAVTSIAGVSALAMEGNRIAVGARPKLVVLTLGETIFQSGMD